jgi:hypothetical protein
MFRNYGTIIINWKLVWLGIEIADLLKSILGPFIHDEVDAIYIGLEARTLSVGSRSCSKSCSCCTPLELD